MTKKEMEDIETVFLTPKDDDNDEHANDRDRTAEGPAYWPDEGYGTNY